MEQSRDTDAGGKLGVFGLQTLCDLCRKRGDPDRVVARVGVFSLQCDNERLQRPLHRPTQPLCLLGDTALQIALIVPVLAHQTPPLQGVADPHDHIRQDQMA
jgi:hypothetical protein